MKKLLVGTFCQSGLESRQSAVAPATGRSACLHVWLVGVATVGEGNPPLASGNSSVLQKRRAADSDWSRVFFSVRRSFIANFFSDETDAVVITHFLIDY